MGLCEASRDGIAKMQPSTVRDTTALTDTQCCIDHDQIIPHADYRPFDLSLCNAFGVSTRDPGAPRVYSAVQISLGVCTPHS